MKFHVIFIAILVALFGLYELGLCTQQHPNKIIIMKMGADEDTPKVAEIESLARFAVQQHNNKENTLLEFVKVLKAKEQVVAGKIYYLTLEAVDAGKKKIYEAKIWVKPWMNFKQLQEFKLVHVISPFRSSGLGVKQEGNKLGWHEMPIHDPNVKDAANYVVKYIAQRSNCLSPYELLDIVRAKTKVIEDYVKFNLLLKVSRGAKEERLRVEDRRRCLRCTAAILLFLLLVAGVFILYPSDPEIQLARIRINHIGIRTNPKPILDLSFSVTVKVRNRDFFSLTYDSLSVAVGYRGRQLGLVHSIGGGRIKARGSSYVDVVLSVDGFEVIYDAFYLIQDIAKGVIPFETHTTVDGKLGLLLFNVPLKATVSCDVYVNLNKQVIERQDCYPESLGDKVDQNANIGVGET